MKPKTIKHRAKIGSRAVPGSPRGPFWFQDGPKPINGAKELRFRTPIVAPKARLVLVFQGLAFTFARGARFPGFWWFWVPEFHLNSLFGFTVRPLGLSENSWKCCNGCWFQTFDASQTEPFCSSWLWVDDEFVADFHDFWLFWVPAFGFRRTYPRWKGGLKTNAKMGAKRRARVFSCSAMWLP